MNQCKWAVILLASKLAHILKYQCYLTESLVNDVWITIGETKATNNQLGLNINIYYYFQFLVTQYANIAPILKQNCELKRTPIFPSYVCSLTSNSTAGSFPLSLGIVTSSPAITLHRNINPSFWGAGSSSFLSSCVSLCKTISEKSCWIL